MSSFSGTIVTLGGGGFSDDARVTPIDDEILRLTGKARPRVCFVPTASGDDWGYAAKFERAFAERAETSVLSLFTKADNDTWTCDPRHVLDVDVVYVGGGSTANLLAIWCLHGLPELLREAAASGTVLAGISAGMNCWFEGSSTDSFGPLAPLNDGLGFLPGSACPHLFGEEGRFEKYQEWVGDGSLPEGYAADDRVAFVWRDARLTDVISEKFHVLGGRMARVEGEPGARWMPLPSRVLDAVEATTPAEHIERILYVADPIGIRAGGSDEYSPEAKAIAEGLPACADDQAVLDLVHITFVHYFDPSTAGPRERYAEIARQIAALDGLSSR